MLVSYSNILYITRLAHAYTLHTPSAPPLHARHTREQTRYLTFVYVSSNIAADAVKLEVNEARAFLSHLSGSNATRIRRALEPLTFFLLCTVTIALFS